MSKTYSYRRLYITTCRQNAGVKLIESGRTIEIDGPLRYGKCIVIRAPFRRKKESTALVIGIWEKGPHHTVTIQSDSINQ